MNPDLRAAVAMSHLAVLPLDVVQALFTGAARRRIAAGSVNHREGDRTAHLELVVSGVVRVFVTAPDGRTMTIRYCRPGALLGAMSLFTSGFLMPASTQALVGAELLQLSPDVVREAAARDARVAGALLGELADRAWSFVHEIPGSAFASVRQRIARHLLDLGSEPGPGSGSGRASGGELDVRITQQELADAVGTVREVVVRVLRDLRQEGAVRTERDRIVITDPGRLIQDLGWNPGS